MNSALAPRTVRTRDGAELAVEVHGSGSRDVVLLHSFGTGAVVWRPLAGLLAAVEPDLRLVAIDARNHGRSARTLEHTSYADGLGDVVDAIAALGLRRPCVVGSSIGASLALDLAVTRPDLVGGAVVAGCALHAPVVMPELAAEMRAMMSGLADDPVATAEAVAPGWFGPLVDPVVPRWIAEMLVTTGTGAGAVADGVLAADPRSSLPAVEVPVTYVAGRLDAIPVTIAQECAGLTPDARIDVLDGVAHMPHLEVPGLMAGIVLRSIAEAGP